MDTLGDESKSCLVVVGFFRDRVMRINNDGQFTVNFTLFKHYF